LYKISLLGLYPNADEDFVMPVTSALDASPNDLLHAAFEVLRAVFGGPAGIPGA